MGIGGLRKERPHNICPAKYADTFMQLQSIILGSGAPRTELAFDLLRELAYALGERRTPTRGLPLATRLRDEVAEWDEGEDIPPLLIEAAEAIELLAARVAELTWALEAICDIGETRDVQVARAALDGRRIPTGDGCAQ